MRIYSQIKYNENESEETVTIMALISKVCKNAEQHRLMIKKHRFSEVKQTNMQKNTINY